MDTYTILNIAVVTLLFVLSAKYDIHMFQLSSYRYDRYFRWLFPKNIHTHAKWLLLLAALCASVRISVAPCDDKDNSVFVPLVLLPAIAYIVYEIKARKGYKTPLVFTDRVKRLFTTALLLYAITLLLSSFFFMEHVAKAAALLLLFSNAVVLLANVVNTPLEKAINRYYYNDAKKIIRSNKGLIVIGVTGSYGKTSTKNYLASILASKYNVLVTPGNYNTLLGVVRTIREHLRPYHQVFIVEMGAKQRGDIKEICDLVCPSIGIVTAVGEMHLETFKCVENIQKTKFELINALPADGVGIMNVDSLLLRSYEGPLGVCRKITYSVDAPSDYKAENVRYGATGVTFSLSGKERTYETRLLGAGNLLNILASVVAADLLDVPLQKQKNAIARLQPVEHRLSMRTGGGITVLDDAYNSNPMGAAMALDVLRNFNVGSDNKRIVITPGFVEMGSRQYAANKELGTRIASSCDYVIVVNETNREAIAEGLAAAGMKTENIFLADTLNMAHAKLSSILKVGDVVLYENDLPDNFK
ncbi:MAG: UDP-N-acetylmuramoyl-tripeptide--D-alanyl-D-alanine ligase [Bacteroidaceae bacterium]|nr:UDP-N-acetylmuramoyl-tripeptide--D-alanyl-D-alanine ligase [Bacteroidaceae bacterium]